MKKNVYLNHLQIKVLKIYYQFIRTNIKVEIYTGHLKNTAK